MYDVAECASVSYFGTWCVCNIDVLPLFIPLFLQKAQNWREKFLVLVDRGNMQYVYVQAFQIIPK